ncbi:MAG: hypothetical protein MI892_21070, partial [Desulfobacterales bacterium]|nr:hypothetical protein [Desulfobacterales bacterium]
AYYLGKISKAQMSELHIIRRIRNDFGHNPESISFETDQIKDRSKSLKTSYHKTSALPRDHFTASVLGLLASIHVTTATSVRLEAKPDRPVTEKEKEKHRKLMEKLSEKILDNPEAE